MVCVHAYPNIKVIHILDVDLNVFLVRIAHVIKLAYEINVQIHALALVDKMHFVMWLIIFLCAVAHQVRRAMHLYNVDQYLVRIAIL